MAEAVEFAEAPNLQAWPKFDRRRGQVEAFLPILVKRPVFPWENDDGNGEAELSEEDRPPAHANRFQLDMDDDGGC
jgi:hypothetical protein